MRASGGALAGYRQDLGAAIGLLTRLPLPRGLVPDGPGAGAWAFPLAGLLIGALQGGLFALLLTGLPPMVAAGLVLGFGLLLTGGLHEDGLADCADGLGGGRSRAQCLELMRDSRIGAYGTLALILGLGLRWAALASLADMPLVALMLVGAVSRMPMALIMATMPLARKDGAAAGVGGASPRAACAALGIAALVAFSLIGWSGLLLTLLPLLVVLPLTWQASAKLAGYTGDVLGAAQQLAEIALLIALTTL